MDDSNVVESEPQEELAEQGSGVHHQKGETKPVSQGKPAVRSSRARQPEDRGCGEERQQHTCQPSLYGREDRIEEIIQRQAPEMEDMLKP